MLDLLPVMADGGWHTCRATMPRKAPGAASAGFVEVAVDSRRVAASDLFALQAILWPASTLLCASLLLWLRVPVGAFAFWGGLAATLVAARAIAGGWRPWLLSVAALAVVAVLSGSALAWILDFSGDGQWYHMPAVLALAQGWNPFEHPQLGSWSEAFRRAISEKPSASIYVQHYAKGTWIIAAATYQATGLLEAAKAVNVLYAAAVYALGVAMLRRKGLPGLWCHGLAAVAAAHPVVLYQVHSYFVDGQVASLLTLLVLLSLEYLRWPSRRVLLQIGACTLLLANMKFTSLVFALALGSGFIVLYWLAGARRSIGPYAVAGLVSTLVAVGVIGYQPYVTNLWFHGNPFYPVLGSDEAARAEMAGQFEIWAPAAFLEKDRVDKLARSLLARSSGAETMPELKVPFTISKQELYIFFNTEPRYGGFGPWFGSALILTLLLFAAAALTIERRMVLGAAAVVALLVLTALLNREAWWARLSPQVWLVPVMLLAALATSRSSWIRRVAAALVLVLLANAALVAALNWGRAFEKNLAFRAQVAELKRMSQTAPVQVTAPSSFRMLTEYRLRRFSVPFERVTTVTCSKPLRFSYPAGNQALACSASPSTQLRSTGDGQDDER